MKSGPVTLIVLSCLGCAGVEYSDVSPHHLFVEDEVRGRIAQLEAAVRRDAADRAALDQTIASEKDEETKRKLAKEREDALNKQQQRKQDLGQQRLLLQKIAEANAGISKENAEIDADARGIRFYQPSPYLLVYSDGKDGLVWEIHSLPDPSKKLSAKPCSFLASLRFTLQFDERGRLTKATEKGDGTAVPKAVLTAVALLAPSLIKALLNEVALSAADHRLPAPWLFKIVMDGDQVRFLGGGRDLETIRISLRPGAPGAGS